MYQQLSELADDAGGVVFGASRGAGIHHHDLVLLERCRDAIADERAIVGGDR